MKLKDLLPINEIEFRNQKEFDKYTKQHKLRPDTKVKIAGKTTTAGQAAKNSKPVGGSPVFGTTPKKGKSNDEFKASYDLADVADDIKGSLDVSDKDGKELQKRLEKGEKGKYNQTSETGGEIVFANGDRYEVGGTQDGPYPVTKKGKGTERENLRTIVSQMYKTINDAPMGQYDPNNPKIKKAIADLEKFAQKLKSQNKTSDARVISRYAKDIKSATEFAEIDDEIAALNRTYSLRAF